LLGAEAAAVATAVASHDGRLVTLLSAARLVPAEVWQALHARRAAPWRRPRPKSWGASRPRASGAPGSASTPAPPRREPPPLRPSSCSGADASLARLARAEGRALADRLTVGETYFFRYPEQFEALSDALQALVERRGGPLRLLSAACSSGEEAGTLAIVLRSA